MTQQEIALRDSIAKALADLILQAEADFEAYCWEQVRAEYYSERLAAERD